MTGHRRRAALVLVLCLAAGAAAVTGHAASLQVDSARLDAYDATQAAPTTTASTTPSDTTAPALTTLEMFDLDTDGFVDRVVATFDETLDEGYTPSNTPWTLADGPSGGSLASVSVSGTTATLTLDEGPGAKNTAVGSFTVALTQHASGIRDAAGNKSSFSATAPTDKAKPIPVSLDIPNGPGTNNKATQGDTIVVAWSEKLLASSICSTGFNDTTTATYDANLNQNTFVRIKDHAEAPATAYDTLTASFNCGAFKFGSLSLGSAAYTSASRSFGDNANAGRARAMWSPTTATFTLTLGKLEGTDVLGTVTPTSAPTAVYTPDPGLTDMAGNTATGTVSKEDTHF